MYFKTSTRLRFINQNFDSSQRFHVVFIRALVFQKTFVTGCMTSATRFRIDSWDSFRLHSYFVLFFFKWPSSKRVSVILYI